MGLTSMSARARLGLEVAPEAVERRRGVGRVLDFDLEHLELVHQDLELVDLDELLVDARGDRLGADGLCQSQSAQLTHI